MAAKLPVWGIDVGQNALKAVKLQLAGDQVEVLDLAVLEHPQLLSQPDSDLATLFKTSIEKFLQKHDTKGARVVVAVPGQQTLTRFAKLPPVEPKKIPDMVNYEAQQQIPFDMDEVVWDYEIFSQADSPDIEIGIFAIRKELIRNHLLFFTSPGIEPVAVQSAPLASYNALRWDGQIGDETTVLLDMGAVSTDLIVVEGKSIWSRPVPLGGNQFTESLVKAFKLSFGKAEALKRQAATSKYSRQIFHAMRPVFADLVSEVQRSIGFYTSTHRQSEIKRVIGMGGAFGLPGLQKYLQQNLQIRVDRFEGFKRVAQSGPAKSPEFAASLLSLPVSFGAALQELTETAVRSSLLPADVVRQQMWKKKTVWFGASAACLAGAAGAVWLGNIMASSALASKIGGVTGAIPCPSVDRAEQILNTPRNPADPPVKYGATVLGALDKLAAEYRGLPKIEEQQSRLNTIGQLPASNTTVPQIFDLVHRVFSGAIPSTIRDINSVDEYIALAAKTPRPERSELYVTRMRMRYDSRDATKSFSASGATVTRGEGEGEATESAAAGWGLVIDGRITRRDAPAWLEEILTRLTEEGRQPKRGFWVDNSKVVFVRKAGAKPLSGAGASSTGFGLPAPGRGGDRNEGRRGAGVDAPAPPPRGGAAPFGGPAAGGEADIRRQIEDLKPKIGIDPLTEESSKDDHEFQIAIVIRKGDTPPDKLKKAAGPAAPAKPGTAPDAAAPPEAPPPSGAPAERD